MGFNSGFKGLKIPGRVSNVVPEKDGDHLDRSCEKLRSITKCRGAEEYPT